MFAFILPLSINLITFALLWNTWVISKAILSYMCMNPGVVGDDSFLMISLEQPDLDEADNGSSRYLDLHKHLNLLGFKGLKLPFKIFLIVPFGLFHIFLRPNSFTRVSSDIHIQSPWVIDFNNQLETHKAPKTCINWSPLHTTPCWCLHHEGLHMWAVVKKGLQTHPTQSGELTQNMLQHEKLQILKDVR